MEWSEDAVVIGTRRHGEADAILEVFTRDRGRHLGLVKGGRSRRHRPLLQAGNTVHVTWRARLSEHLGNFRAEPVRDRAAQLMARAEATFGIQLLAAHIRLLPERDPHPRLYDVVDVVADNLANGQPTGELVVRFELLLLEELGFGLDLTACAATGSAADLVYVSPRTGRAVSRDAGQPYDNRLLPLPSFLADRRPGMPPGDSDLKQAFRLTEYFLNRHIYSVRDLEPPIARDSYLRSVLGL